MALQSQFKKKNQVEASGVRQEDLKLYIFSFKHQIDCHRTEMHYEKNIDKN